MTSDDVPRLRLTWVAATRRGRWAGALGGSLGGAADQHRALDEEVQLGKVAGPCHLGYRGCGPVALNTSTSTGPNRPVIAATSSATCGLIGDVSAEGPSDATAVTDAAGDLPGRPVAAPAIDRHRQAVAGQTPRDHRAQAPRAARHQRDTPLRHRHEAIMPTPLAAPRRPQRLRGPIRTGRTSAIAVDHVRPVRLVGADDLEILVDESVARPVDADVVDLILAFAQLHHAVDDPTGVGGQRRFGRLAGGCSADDRP